MKREKSEIRERCKQKVYPKDRYGAFWPHQCKKLATKDGFCAIHHPDHIEERRRKVMARHERKRQESAWFRLEKANDTIKELKEEIERLKKLLEEKYEK